MGLTALAELAVRCDGHPHALRGHGGRELPRHHYGASASAGLAFGVVSLVIFGADSIGPGVFDLRPFDYGPILAVQADNYSSSGHPDSWRNSAALAIVGASE